MTPGSPTVVVVDDDAAVRDGLRRLISSVGLGVEVFPTAQAFLRARRPDAPGCLVLDVRLPGLSGLDLQRELAMKAGAVEFLTKPFRAQDLLDGIRSAIERDRAERGDRHELTELRRRYASLTPRERDVLRGVVAGQLNKQIAGELGTSEVTVKEQRGHGMHKMQARSVAELVRFASRLGITSAGSDPSRPT